MVCRMRLPSARTSRSRDILIWSSRSTGAASLRMRAQRVASSVRWRLARICTSARGRGKAPRMLAVVAPSHAELLIWIDRSPSWWWERSTPSKPSISNCHTATCFSTHHVATTSDLWLLPVFSWHRALSPSNPPHELKLDSCHQTHANPAASNWTYFGEYHLPPAEMSETPHINQLHQANPMDLQAARHMWYINRCSFQLAISMFNSTEVQRCIETAEAGKLLVSVQPWESLLSNSFGFSPMRKCSYTPRPNCRANRPSCQRTGQRTWRNRFTTVTSPVGNAVASDLQRAAIAVCSMEWIPLVHTVPRDRPSGLSNAGLPLKRTEGHLVLPSENLPIALLKRYDEIPAAWFCCNRGFYQQLYSKHVSQASSYCEHAWHSHR